MKRRFTKVIDDDRRSGAVDLDPLLRKRRISTRKIIDGCRGPIRKRDLYPIVLIAARMPSVVQGACLDLDSRRMRDVICEVDEVASFAEEASTANLRIQEPVILGKRASIDPTQEPQSRPVLTDCIQRPFGSWREPPVEAHHQPPLRCPDGRGYSVQLCSIERERLLDECRLVRDQGRLCESGMGIVAGGDDHHVGIRIGKRCFGRSAGDAID